MRYLAQVIAAAGLALAVGCAQKAEQAPPRAEGQASNPSDDPNKDGDGTVAPMPREVASNTGRNTTPVENPTPTVVDPKPMVVNPKPVEPQPTTPGAEIAPMPRVRVATEPEKPEPAVPGVEVAPAPRAKMN
ncbi:MAG TPA: hypothetical protein VKE74_23100 [Gemmataceae bacterium]|nr:hypothetical protein [Gemmataceae bacterium]